jgi:hypothetical protein
VLLSLNNVSPLVEHNVATKDNCCKTVQYTIRRKIDFIQEDPVTVLYAFDESSLDKLEDEPTTRLQLLCPFVQVSNLSVKLVDNLWILRFGTTRLHPMLQTLHEVVDFV